MPVETGEQTQLAFIQEAVFGTTPATPTGQLLRYTDLNLGPDANYIENPEFRTDGMVSAGRRGALKGNGTIGGKLSYGTYDAFLAAACGMFGWLSNVTKIKAVSVAAFGVQTVTVAATGKTFTRSAGSYTTDGFAVGDYVQWSGFTNAANNITVCITTLTDTIMTCSGATGLSDEATVSGVKCVTNVRPSFTLEKGHKVNSNYFPFLGAVIDGFTMTGKVGQAVDINFDILAKSVSNEATSTLFTSLTAVNTNDLITAWDGSIKRATVAIANVLSWSLKVARNCDEAEVVGSSSLYDIQPRAAKVTGSMELYFDSITSYNDYRAETDLALQINLGPGGTKSYQIDLTKVRYKNWKCVPKSGMCTATVDFESYAPNSTSNTSLMITRTAT